jgi:hypothetical protein
MVTRDSHRSPGHHVDGGSPAEDKVLLYVNTINMLWQLGLKAIVEPQPAEPDF